MHGRDGCPHAARTRRQLSDYRQRCFPGDESFESNLSQLGDSLCRPGLLLSPPSRRVAGENPRGWLPSPRRATLSATGYAAALAPASPARTAGRGPQPYPVAVRFAGNSEETTSAPHPTNLLPPSSSYTTHRRQL